MKYAVVCVLVLVVAAVYAAPKPGETYESKLDAINVDEVLKNDRLVKSYINCFLNKGKCTPDARDIKEQVIAKLPEMLETNCEKCSEDQKSKGRKILKHMRDSKKAEFDELLEQYDPNGKLRTQYKEKYSKISKDEGFAEIFQ